MDNLEETLTEPASLLLKSANFYVLLFLAQFFLLINGEYLYGISQGAVILYMFAPLALIYYMLSMTELDDGTRVTWEDLESSMRGKNDPISKRLREAGWKVTFFSVGIQLIYFTFAIMFTSVVLLVLIYQGALPVAVIDAIAARSALIYTVLLVAPSETLIFQAIIPLWVALTFAKSEKVVWLTYGISQVIFGIYHYAAYGGSFQSIVIAIALGSIFLYCVRSYGIAFAVGVHASWNLAVLGVTTIGMNQDLVLMMNMIIGG